MNNLYYRWVQNTAGHTFQNGMNQNFSAILRQLSALVLIISVPSGTDNYFCTQR